MRKMSANPMGIFELSLRTRIASDVRLWVDEMEQSRKDWEASGKTPVVEMDPYDELRGVADLIEGGYRGNCSLYCDQGRHSECRREGCCCKCHDQD